jgi:hypothetical protein
MGQIAEPGPTRGMRRWLLMRGTPELDLSDVPPVEA